MIISKIIVLYDDIPDSRWVLWLQKSKCGVLYIIRKLIKQLIVFTIYMCIKEDTDEFITKMAAIWMVKFDL